jgi:predicted DNA-binding transcriptional regulator AlpA
MNPSQGNQQARRLADLESAIKLVGSPSRPTFYRWQQHEGCPKPIKLSPQCARWDADELIAWVEARAECRVSATKVRRQAASAGRA